jgi:Zn-dependent protease
LLARSGFRKFRLFTVSGIDIYLDPSWLIIFLLITFSLAFTFMPAYFPLRSPIFLLLFAGLSVIVFMATLFLHELAHSLVAKMRGIDVESITLYLFGGVARILKEPSNPSDEVLMAAAGPLTSFILSGVAYIFYSLLKDHPTEFWFPFYFVALANLGVAIFNLTPAFPLDGGRLLRSLFWLLLKNRLKATVIAANLSSILSLFFFASGIYLGFKSEADGFWLSLISLAILFYSRESLKAAYQNEILDMKLNELFEIESLMEDQVYPYDFDYAVTVEASSDIKIYDLLKTMRESRPFLLAVRDEDKKIILLARKLEARILDILERAGRVLKLKGR